MSETNLWHRLRTNMVPEYWSEATRHEDKLNKGVPDVSFCMAKRHGWMELKHVADWPARETTIVRVPHYTVDQKNFLTRKGEGAGNTWLLMQVGSDHLLFDHLAAQTVGELSAVDLFASANASWANRLNYGELAEYLLLNI